jgi:hypothetical protein
VAATACLIVSVRGYAEDVWTYHNDNDRSGLNKAETELTVDKVQMKFGKRFTKTVDGWVYAQPLVLQGVAIAGKGTHDVVFVATQHDSVYAFDAKSSTSPDDFLWKQPFIDETKGVTTVPANRSQREGPNDLGPCNCIDIFPEIGITGTPVIDRATMTLYVVPKTKEIIGGHTHYVQRLHALDVRDKSEKFGGPVVIADTICDDGRTFQYVTGPVVPGNGESNLDGSHVFFNALRQHQRAGLALGDRVIGGAKKKVVYVAWASHCDTAPAHGWLVGFDATSLEVVGVFNTTPNSTSSSPCLPGKFAAGSIWQSGGAPAIDASGALYFATGNGFFDAVNPAGFPASGNYGNSVLKLVADPSSTPAAPNMNGWGFKVDTFFTPFNQQLLEDADTDLGSGGVVLLNDQPATGQTTLVANGKPGTIYVLDPTNMGKFHAGDDSQIRQSLPRATGAVFGMPAVFNDTIYYGAMRDFMKAFSIKGGKISTAGPPVQGALFQFPGATPSISSNDTAEGIVWALRTESYATIGGHATLHAFAADDLREIYNSNNAGTRDLPGGAVKFAVPTVVNGKVYVGTQSSLDVYGLLN